MFKKNIWWLALATLIISLAPSAHAAVAGLIFTTDEQVIAVGATSDKITVSTGEAVGETADITLSSSSPTGEFSSSNTNWQATNQLTWNSNWANRSFYYRDSAAGTATLTVRLTTRTSGQSWSAVQTITVGNAAGSSDNGTGNAGTDNAAGSGSSPGSTTSSNSSSSAALSSHSSPSPVSNLKIASKLAVSAGRERLAAVGAPVWFEAAAEGGENEPRFRWSFGDGAADVGRTVRHAYRLPGNYEVVLNAVAGDERAVSRTRVRVVRPELVFRPSSAGDGLGWRLDLSNTGQTEINLGGWRLGQFVFPDDTIIATGATLPLAPEQFGFGARWGVTLYYPDGRTALTYGGGEGVEAAGVSHEARTALANILQQLTVRNGHSPF